MLRDCGSDTLRFDPQQPTVFRRAQVLFATQQQSPLIAFEHFRALGKTAFQTQLRQLATGGQQGDGFVAQQAVALGHHRSHAHRGRHGHGDDRQGHQHFDQGEAGLRRQGVTWRGLGGEGSLQG